MFTRLTLARFKSFEAASLPLSPFTLLVGANASGKSNLREAFRFLHGVSRGYTLAEIVGEKWIEGGVRVWTGLRGGPTSAFYNESGSFSLRGVFTVEASRFDYRIDVQIGRDLALRVVREHLKEAGKYVFDTHPDELGRGEAPPTIRARVRKGGRGAPPDVAFLLDRPLLPQLVASSAVTDATRKVGARAMEALASMVFLDLSPQVARESSPVRVSTLGDRGENLSSVLSLMTEDDNLREQLVSWVRALTPVEAVDLDFDTDLNGRILGVLVEAKNRRTPFSSASDGTVRFLAVLAALLSPARPRFLFFEELENGIHPSRVSLLLDLIEQSAGHGRSQIVATSHSPQLLLDTYRTPGARPCLVFRSEDGASHVLDVRAQKSLNSVLREQDPARLMAAGWFEDVAAFLADDLSASA